MELQLNNPLVFALIGIHGFSLLFSLIALGTMGWAVFSGTVVQQSVNVHSGLWKRCLSLHERETPVQKEVCVHHHQLTDWEKGTSAVMVIAMFAVITALVAVILPIFLKLRTKLLMAMAAVAGGVAALFSFIGVCVYGARVAGMEIYDPSVPVNTIQMSPGYSFGLAVVHFALAVGGTITAAVGYIRTGQFE